MSAESELVAAIIGRLSGYSQLTDLIGTYQSDPAIFWHVPQGYKGSPYVVMYEINLDEMDTCNTLGFSGYLTFNSWSRDRDILEVSNIKDAIYGALHYYDGLILANYGVSSIYQSYQSVSRDPDGITYRGVQRFNVTLDKLIV